MECSTLDRTGVRGLDRSPVINIDHHPGNANYGAINWVDEGAAACGELVFTLIDALGVPLTPDIATHLYLAILTDTGSFRFSHLTPRTYALAGRAVAAGADPQWIARTHYDSNSLARVRIFGAVLNGMSIHAGGRVALLAITQQMARDLGGTYDDTEGLINFPLTVKDIQAVAFFKEIGARRLARQPPFQGGGRHGADRQAVRRRRAHERLGLRLAGLDRRGAGHLRAPARRGRRGMIAGVLVVDKPEGLTSHDVVAAARRALGERRIGHCGTLDPMATGVLALAIGHATRLVQFLSGRPEALRRGRPFRAGDRHLRRHRRGGWPNRRRGPARRAVETALRRISWARPSKRPRPSRRRRSAACGPMRWRAGQAAGTTLLGPVEVTCHDLTLTAFDGERAWLTMTVSAGFYVRSLAHDLGRALGIGGRAGRAATHAGGPFRSRTGSVIRAPRPGRPRRTPGAIWSRSRICSRRRRCCP